MHKFFRLTLHKRFDLNDNDRLIQTLSRKICVGDRVQRVSKDFRLYFKIEAYVKLQKVQIIIALLIVKENMCGRSFSTSFQNLQKVSQKNQIRMDSRIVKKICVGDRVHMQQRYIESSYNKSDYIAQNSVIHKDHHATHVNK